MSVFSWLHTQNIHATFELQRLFDDKLRLLGNVSHQTLYGGGGIDLLLNNHLYLLCDCLDLKLKEGKTLVMSLITNTGISYDV